MKKIILASLLASVFAVSAHAQSFANKYARKLVLSDGQVPPGLLTLTTPSALGGPYTLTLPSALPASNALLTTDNTGALSWTLTSSVLTGVIADAPLSGAGTSGSHLVIAQANGSTSGYLSSTDWTNFNNKQAALTGLTNKGAVYATGPGSITSTVAMTDGQLLIGNSAGNPTLATLTAGSNVTITNGNGTITINSTGGGGGLTGGTINQIPVWTSGTAIGNSSIADNGTDVTTTENLKLTGANKTLTFTGNSSGVSTIAAGNQNGTTLNYTLPITAPSANQVLTATGVSGGNVTFGWSTTVTSSSGTGGIDGSYIARAPMDSKSNSGATSNVAVNATGLAFPVGAGEIWEFIFNISASSQDANGINIGLAYPSGAEMEATVEGLVDMGASGHTAYYRLTKPATAGTSVSGTALTMVGGAATNALMSVITNNGAGGPDTIGGLRIAGYINNTAGSAGTVQLVFANAKAGVTTLQTIRKGSFLTAWKYAGAYTLDKTYTSSTTAVVPAGVSTIYVTGAGGAGGGGGGGAEVSNANKRGGGSGGGGGAGEYFTGVALSVTPGETLTITIGSGGTAGSGGAGATNTAGTNGGNGGTTSISGSVSGSIFSANGGTGGTAGGNSTAAANGTAGSGGAGGVTAGSTPAASGTAGVSGSNGAAGNTTGAAVPGGAGGSNPTNTANTGGTGGAGGNNGLVNTAANGSNGTTGTSGFVTITY